MTELLQQAKATSEEWRDIPGFEGYYQASTLGRIRSLERVVPLVGHPTLKKRTMPQRIIKPKLNRPTGHAYCRHLVVLCRHGQELTFNVARLVAETFIPNPNGYDCVLHLDDDATNNRVENLEWGTQSENVRQAVQRKRYRQGDSHHASVLSHEQRLAARALLADGLPVKKVAAIYAVQHQVISDLKNGKIRGFPDMRKQQSTHR